MTITLRSEITVEEIQAVGSDDIIVHAARVSTRGNTQRENVDEKEAAGLIRYLMRSRHGCYDDQTEVLTDEGWKPWPSVTGRELFLTLAPDDSMAYQPADRLVVRPHDGDMIKVCMAHVDALVTPDHRMLAERRTRVRRQSYQLVPAHHLMEAAHRMRLGGGVWDGEEGEASDLARMSLVGFFIGDGHSNNQSLTPTFHLRRPRKISYLLDMASLAGFDVTQSGERYHLRADESFRNLARMCYAADGSKIVPRDVLMVRGRESMRWLLKGLMQSDGSTGAKGKETYSTTSQVLAGQIQEVALKAGRAAIVHDHPFAGDDGHYGSKARYLVTIYRKRNAQPRVGWTVQDRVQNVQTVPYKGNVYCVTVPNGTLYVRRNGKPLWCGNTPFEHGALTVCVHAPIKVWREWHRHRVGWSYNETSGRYKQLEPVFWIPPRERPLLRPEGFRSANPSFELASEEEYEQIVGTLTRGYEESYARYEELLALGVDRGLARDVLGVGIFSSCYCTANPRSIMAFLELRTNRPEAKRPSKPLWEIANAAEQLEAIFASHWPITHAAFCEFGRMAP